MSNCENRYVPRNLQTYINDLGGIQTSAQEDAFFNHVYKVMKDVSGEFDDFFFSNFHKILAEALFYKRGVTVHVSDKTLIETLMRCQIDNVLCSDVRIPFPIMEFAFPKNIPLLNNKYELSGCFIIKWDQLKIEENNLLKLYHSRVEDNDGKNYISIYMLGRYFNSNKYFMANTGFSIGKILKNNIDDFYAWTKGDRQKIIDEKSHSLPPIDDPNFQKIPKEDLDQLLIIHFHLIMSIFLYCQALQDKRTLSPVSPKNSHEPLMTKRLKKEDEKRNHFSIANLLPEYKMEKEESPEGTHASPCPHWRSLVIRTLRSEKFKRNPDGSCKVIMVQPCMVGFKNSSDKITSERKIEEVIK